MMWQIREEMYRGLLKSLSFWKDWDFKFIGGHGSNERNKRREEFINASRMVDYIIYNNKIHKDYTGEV